MAIKTINVEINNNGYQMALPQYKMFLNEAKKVFQGENAIYAVEKSGTALMLKEKYSTKKELHDAVNKYAVEKFKVYFVIKNDENEVKN